MNEKPPTHTAVGNRFAPGNQAAAVKKPYQPEGQRFQYWRDKSAEELLKFVDEDALERGVFKLNMKEIRKLGGRDMNIVIRVLQSNFSEDPGKESERILSRIEGQPVAVVDMNLNGNVSNVPITDAERTAQLASLLERVRERIAPGTVAEANGVEPVSGTTDTSAN